MDEPRKIYPDDLTTAQREEMQRNREREDEYIELLPGTEGAFSVMVHPDMLADMTPEEIEAVKAHMREVASKAALDKVRREAGDPEAPPEPGKQLFETTFYMKDDEDD